MKRKSIVGWIMAGTLVGGLGTAVLAQDGAGRKGHGYGGPPANAEERAARQAACLEKNGGVCPQGGPRQECAGPGAGQGKSWRRGACDGTGPRATGGTCPNAPVQSEN